MRLIDMQFLKKAFVRVGADGLSPLARRLRGRPQAYLAPDGEDGAGADLSAGERIGATPGASIVVILARDLVMNWPNQISRLHAGWYGDCRKTLALAVLLWFDPANLDGRRAVVCLAVGQASLVEALLPAASGSNQRRERIRAQVNWQPIEATLQPMRRAPTGRPAYPPLEQLKALLLQHLRGLLTAPAWQPALPFLLDGKSTGCRIVISKKPWPTAEP